MCVCGGGGERGLGERGRVCMCVNVCVGGWIDVSVFVCTGWCVWVVGGV